MAEGKGEQGTQAAPELIPARKSAPAMAIMERVYLRPSLRRHFHSIWLSVDPQARQALSRRAEDGRPVVYASPHPSWWDGHLAWLVEGALGKRESYLMMDVVSLRNYRFFTWAGAFSVDRDDPRAALASIDYIAGILRSGPHKALWIFPQGTITPRDRRPIRYYPGLAHVVRRLDSCYVVPVVWRIEYRLEQHPEVYCRVAAPQSYSGGLPGSRDITRRLEEATEAEDDELRELLARTEPKDIPPGYAPLLRGRGSTHRRWDAVLEAARGLRSRLTGGRRQP